MAPSQHIEWLSDNTQWFLDLPVSSLTKDVPACPGWDVEKVITHLAYGLGLGYPYALAAAPSCPDSEAFADVPWPGQLPTGPDVFIEFDRTMTACIEAFRNTDPATPCYTYQGPGTAAFWFRRAAIETTLHRMDVVEALSLRDAPLNDARANDAIAETVEFALPLAVKWTSAQTPAVSVRIDSSPTTFDLGDGPASAEISGSALSVLSALWGRSQDGVEIRGNARAASQWMSVIEKAFGGR